MPTDKQSAERARAREWRDKRTYATLTGWAGANGNLVISDEGLNAELAEFAALAVEREREECAKAVCEHCANGVSLHESKRYHVKPQLNSEPWYPDCAAEDIWARDAERG